MTNRSFFIPIGVAILLFPVLIIFNNCGGPEAIKSNTLTNDSTAAPDTVLNVVAGKAYFGTTVEPLFQNRCISCHNQPRFGGNAPLTIFNYADMSDLLGRGSSATDNRLVNIMQNIDAHEGGNTCPSGITSSPCREIIEWRQIERPFEDTGGLGAVTFLSLRGSVSGWAKDPDNETATLNVLVYADGPADSGSFLGTFTANEEGSGGIHAGHYFSFDLPAEYRNGQNHQLYVYAEDTADENLLPGLPRSYIAYTPTPEGRQFFLDSVEPGIRCVNCHVWSYETAYATLLTPTPTAGGTATNNNFINFSSGGSNHPGGNICGGGKNSGVCAQLQIWWAREFQ